MTGKVRDIHPRITSADKISYPRMPLFGIQLKCSSEWPTPIEGMIAAMDAAEVDEAPVVRSSSCCGNNCADSAGSFARCPSCFTGVGSIGMVLPDDLKTSQQWGDRGSTGIRVCTGGTRKDFVPGALTDPQSFPVWELATEKYMAICLQIDMSEVSAITERAKHFPKVKIVIDHLGWPPVTDGPPHDNAKTFWALAQIPTVYMKPPAQAFDRMSAGNETPETFVPRLAQEFSAGRIAWGSNFAASDGPMTDLVAYARKRRAVLGEVDRDFILAKTPELLHPAHPDT